VDYAISLKQPWAALVVHGRKSIEIRRWSTRRLGRVLIHAARTPDPRPQAWAKVPAHLAEAARLNGGIVGEAHLVECRQYTSRQSFVQEQALHLNEPSWFKPPALYGFVFTRPRPLPFVSRRGALYFFEVAGHPSTEDTGVRLLVSVRSPGEAQAALAGGPDLIDIKAPRRGPLGRAGDEVIKAVIRTVANRLPVSAALGELGDMKALAAPPGLAFIKFGLAKMGTKSGWQRRLDRLREDAAKMPIVPEVVTVAYADWQRARSPSWREVAKYALRRLGGVLLLDTFDKTWHPAGKWSRPASLLDWLSVVEVRELADRCRDAGVRLALAGSLFLPHIHRLLDARPTWFAVRGAVCDANRRDGSINALKVRALAELLRWHARQ
jgi:(5-formylfuran-3-yl)methyl phosphate synthase